MLGDVFVARAQDDNNEVYSRQDFCVADFVPDAEWVQLARLHNEAIVPAGSNAGSNAEWSQLLNNNKTTATTTTTATTAKQLSKFEDDLEKWVQTKLVEFDGDETARKKHEKKHGSRQGFEASLRAKVKAKLDLAKV
ncbi:unnamed protein product [Polarella glacialis]|uniref:Uncharacterized protein n=1 Tax=Polarella glacialis TaxID=89957 RepID=A0A813DGY2_POLGL|nr:unnamed protein product [Polarella glacialis]CAE8605276.1 unnamed protein product [Polarella glacialis]